MTKSPLLQLAVVLLPFLSVSLDAYQGCRATEQLGIIVPKRPVKIKQVQSFVYRERLVSLLVTSDALPSAYEVGVFVPRWNVFSSSENNTRDSPSSLGTHRIGG
jgi:hypothetical protein